MPATPSWIMTLARWHGKGHHMIKDPQEERIMKALTTEPGSGQIRTDDYPGKEETLLTDQMTMDRENPQAMGVEVVKEVDLQMGAHQTMMMMTMMRIREVQKRVLIPLALQAILCPNTNPTKREK